MIHGLAQTYIPARRLLQRPFNAAVVIPTVIRPSLARAVRSIFAQRFQGNIQILVGIDQPIGDLALIEQLEKDCPAHCVLCVLDVGYSTSVRHGGLHPGASGGVLRTVLSYLANSRLVAYLDDDNWWGPDHLQTLCDAIRGYHWAYSLRWFVDEETAQPLCQDEWESVGPDAGVFKEKRGGFVDTNCLMLDKIVCEPALRLWSIPLMGDQRAMSEDRQVFNYLKGHHRSRGTGQATAFYVMQPTDAMHRHRKKWIKQKLTQGTSTP